MTMMNMRDRYRDDPLFHRLVDTLVMSIEQGLLTPTETREAAMLAQIMYEDRHSRPLQFTREDVIKGRV